MNRNEYLYLENVIGLRFGDVNAAQAKAVEQFVAGDAKGALTSILSASALNSQQGEAFAIMARAMRAALAPEPDKPVTGLRPGQVVVDVGGGGDATVWRGQLAPTDPRIKENDWRVLQQNYQYMPIVDIFSSSPAGKARTDDGRDFTQGDGAFPIVNVAEYKASGAIFAAWLP